jgi:hypothetical protein
LLQPGDVGNVQKVVYTFATVFEVETRVLEGGREVNDGLSNIVDLLMRRNLEGPLAVFECSILEARLTIIWNFPGGWGRRMARDIRACVESARTAVSARMKQEEAIPSRLFSSAPSADGNVVVASASGTVSSPSEAWPGRREY